MILKEPYAIASSDPLTQAGHKAEAQLAFYLRRDFAQSPNIRVFNNIRLERDQDAAQIDHLILHHFGMIIIESKSVTSSVQINEREEWTRWWNGKPQGMASPILQARRQGDFLRGYLEASAEHLRGKIFGLIQGHFTHMPIDLLVAISDDGTIQQPKNKVQAAVCKADQVPDRVRAIIEGHKRAASLLSLSTKGGYQLSEAECVRITEFLLAENRPLKAFVQSDFKGLSSGQDSQTALPVSQKRQSPNVDKSMATQSCRKCHSPRISIEYGKFGYYFKCADCEGNTPIKAICAECNGKARIRKSGLRFFADCEACTHSALYHVNSGVPVSFIRTG